MTDRTEMDAARTAGLRVRHETREARAIRREVANEIAEALEAERSLMESLPIDDPAVSEVARLVIPARAATFGDAAKIARQIGAEETPS